MENKNNEENNSEQSFKLVVFELDKEEYAVEITELQEIINIPEITPVPNAPKFIKGILNLRGKISVVVDLEKRFDLVREFENKEEGNVIITEVEGNNFGVIVDKVSEIITVQATNIQPTPALISTKIHADYLKGVVVIDDEEVKTKEKTENDNSRLLILLDLKRMLKEEELLKFGKAVKEVVK